MEPNRFPKARQGNGNMHGGFGFNGPSEAWLKANNLKSNYSTSNSGTEESLSFEEKEDRRKKALERFEKPQEEIKLIPEEKKLNIISEEEKKRKEDIAKAREEVLRRNQMELDSIIVPLQPTESIKSDPEKRKKCLSRITVIPKEIEIPSIDIKLNLEKFIDNSADFYITSGDNVKIGVHKAILAARSLVLRNILTSNSREVMKNELILDGYSGESVRNMIYFLYTGQAKVNNYDIIELLYLAEYFKLESLKLVIEQQLEKFIDVENIITLWEVSEEIHLESLKQECVKFCKKTPEVRKIYSQMPDKLKELYLKLIKKKDS